VRNQHAHAVVVSAVIDSVDLSRVAAPLHAAVQRAISLRAAAQAFPPGCEGPAPGAGAGVLAQPKAEVPFEVVLENSPEAWQPAPVVVTVHVALRDALREGRPIASEYSLRLTLAPRAVEVHARPRDLFLSLSCFPYPPVFLIHLFSLSTCFPYPLVFLIHLFSLSTCFPYPPVFLIHLFSLSTCFPYPLVFLIHLLSRIRPSDGV